MRQAFKAAALPPLQYAEPSEGDRATLPREDMAYEDIARQPLFFTPLLERRPMERRATPDQEEKMLRWASHGITRVEHVLTAGGAAVETVEGMVARYPGLADSAYPRGRITLVMMEVRANLSR